MAIIKIVRSHDIELDQLKLKIDNMLEQLNENLQLDKKWHSSNKIQFSRKGAKGELVFDHKSLEVTVRLGLMLRAFKKTIEAELISALNKLTNA